jgi:hypothetical protein
MPCQCRSSLRRCTRGGWSCEPCVHVCIRSSHLHLSTTTWPRTYGGHKHANYMQGSRGATVASHRVPTVTMTCDNATTTEQGINAVVSLHSCPSCPCRFGTDSHRTSRVGAWAYVRGCVHARAARDAGSCGHDMLCAQEKQTHITRSQRRARRHV